MDREELRINDILKRLKCLSNPKAIEGMAKFGITAKRVYGVSIPSLRKIAKETGKDHELAQKLWKLNIRETRILASMIDDPALVTEKQMEKWVKEFDYWEICDQVCQNLFIYTEFAYKKAIEWSEREEEFVKRAGFALMAWLAFKDKEAKDEQFEKFLPIIKKEASDNRDIVKKAVNWALRQIGKRNLNLNRKAIEIAQEIQKIESKTAKWIASDAIRELTSEAIQKRLEGKDMNKKMNEKFIAYCGLYCGDCFFYKGEIADLARDLRKKLREAKFHKTYEEFSKFAKEFKGFPICYEVLGAMVKMRCKGCRDGGGPPFCKIRRCCQKREFEGCWECNDFETCKKLDFLKPNHGDAHIKNLRKIRKQGIKAFLEGKRCW